VAAAQPEIDEKTSQLVSKGRWSVPGYKVCFVSLWIRRIAGCVNYFTGEIRRPLDTVDDTSNSSLCILY
jgi:hypothetical protein